MSRRCLRLLIIRIVAQDVEKLGKVFWQMRLDLSEGARIINCDKNTLLWGIEADFVLMLRRLGTGVGIVRVHGWVQ